MIKVIRKKKRLFEDDNQQQVQQNPNTPAQPQTVLQPAPVQQLLAPATAQQPANNPPLQQAALPAQLANPQQPATDQNQQQQLQQNLDTNTQQAVLDILKNMENQYWCVANNVPEMIKEKIPTFTKDNEQAKPIIANWDAFKANPSELTFNAFIDSFKTFGSPVQLDQQQGQPLANVLESRKTVYNFRKALEERLQQANRAALINSYFNNY